MEHEVKLYRKYKRNLRFLLLGSGLWPDYEAHPDWFRTFLSCCSAFTTGATTVGIILFCVHHIANINVLTRGLGLMISFASACLKVCVLTKHKADISKLNHGLSTRFEEDLVKPENREHLLAHFRTVSWFFYVFKYSVALSNSLIVITSLLALRHGKYPRMYPTLIPFSYEPGGLIHWLIYGNELMACFYLWSVTCGVDSFFGLYTLHIVGELRVLSHHFRQLKCNSDYAKNLKECMSRHTQLLEAKRILERVFGFLAIWMAVTCAICVCSLIFQVREIKQLSVVKVCHLICYTLLKGVQAYSYAWFGAIISVESTDCLESMYNANWSGSGDIKFMKDVLIVLSQKPMVFIAKGVVLVEMGLFMKVVNTTVSYFFLLQTLEEKLA